MSSLTFKFSIFILNNFFYESYSSPDIFSLTSNIQNSKRDTFRGTKINTSFIQSLPFGETNVQSYLPFLPYAIEQLDLRKYDLIISNLCLHRIDDIYRLGFQIKGPLN